MKISLPSNSIIFNMKRFPASFCIFFIFPGYACAQLFVGGNLLAMSAGFWTGLQPEIDKHTKELPENNFIRAGTIMKKNEVSGVELRIQWPFALRRYQIQPGRYFCSYLLSLLIALRLVHKKLHLIYI